MDLIRALPDIDIILVVNDKDIGEGMTRKIDWFLENNYHIPDIDMSTTLRAAQEFMSLIINGVPLSSTDKSLHPDVLILPTLSKLKLIIGSQVKI